MAFALINFFKGLLIAVLFLLSILFLVTPKGFEPLSSEPKSDILIH